MSVHIFGGVCDCCGHERELSRQEEAYEEAVEKLILAARAVRRRQSDVERDIRDWFRAYRVEDAAVLDKDIVRFWWTVPEKWDVVR